MPIQIDRQWLFKRGFCRDVLVKFIEKSRGKESVDISSVPEALCKECPPDWIVKFCYLLIDEANESDLDDFCVDMVDKSIHILGIDLDDKNDIESVLELSKEMSSSFHDDYLRSQNDPESSKYYYSAYSGYESLYNFCRYILAKDKLSLKKALVSYARFVHNSNETTETGNDAWLYILNSLISKLR